MIHETKNYIPQHKLSELSIQRRRNFFIWAPSMRLEGGLHLDDRNPITVAKLYRWFALIMEDSSPFCLHPVHILLTNAIFRYLPVAAGHALARDSQIYITPGDVGIFLPGEDQSKYQSQIRFNKEYLSYWEEDNYWPERPQANYMTEPFVEEVRIRDGRRCAVTGASSAEASLTVCWIVLPSTADKVEQLVLPDLTPIRADMTPYLATSNAWTLRTDLAEMFTNNQWGVDVEDNCRVVFFGLYDSYAHLLPQIPSNLPLDTESGPIRERLKEHFTRCLASNILGGDIHDKYDGFDLKGYLDDMGYYEDGIDSSDPAWQTELGKEVWELLIRRRYAERQVSSLHQCWRCWRPVNNRKLIVFSV